MPPEVQSIDMKQMSDLDLAKFQGQSYEIIARERENIRAIVAEIKRREELESKKTNDKDAGQSSKQDSPEKK